jgi:hypothetical protein
VSNLTFKVTDTRQINTLTQAGSTVTVYRVWITTNRGATGTLDVPQEQWTTEALPKLLAEKAQELDLAMMMTS